MPRRNVLVLTLVGAVLVAAGVTFALRGGEDEQPPAQPVAAREVAVSRLPGPQSESAIAIDPRRPAVLLAGSNDVRSGRMAVYGSTDGGRHWSRRHLADPPGVRLCEMSDPAVAIDLQGRQFYSFLGLTCAGRLITSASVYLATRADAGARWRTLRIAVARPGRLTLADDRPTLLVDANRKSPHRGRLYVGWTRFAVDPEAFVDPEEENAELVDARALISHSDDLGRHWAKPSVLDTGGDPFEVRLATSASGTLYATWRESETDTIFLARADDGSHFVARTFVAAAVVPQRRSCHRFRARIPAQPRRCVSPNPVVSVDVSGGERSGRVYVTYGSTSLYRTQDVYVAAFDPELKPLLGVGTPKQVSPPAAFAGPDTFLPTSALDPKTGHLWACYYESGRRARRSIARYACTVSSDGGRTWSAPRRVARVPSNETGKRANRENGYGDYEGVAAFAGKAHAIWTDGRDLRGRGEEIYTARLVER